MNDPLSILVNRARQLLRSTGATVVVDQLLIERAIRADAPIIEAMTAHSFSEEELAEAIRRVETLFIVEQGPALSLTGELRPPQWYVGDVRRPGLFMQRYLDKLAENDWPQKSIEELQESTARVLSVLDNPQRDGPWDWRGLVVGDVQSGKTAHYAGVINRAADAGYRVIVVLAGMHDVLRLQTQKRLEQDFLGYDTTPRPKGETAGRKPIGVGEINPRLIVDSLTNAQAKGDFSQRVADQANFAPVSQPCLLVVKKNGRILENLNGWIGRLPEESRKVPLLVIDDEADQASIDTKDQPVLSDDTFVEDYDPTRINGQIRKLLNAFGRSAYVGYTATPFANILMHDERSAASYGADLFPSTFILSLTPPDDYFGPVPVFGTTDGEIPGLSLVRDLGETSEGWIPDKHDKTHRPRWKGEDVLPPSLERAINSFLIVCAARSARGQVTVHNSMLVHVSRYVDVHARVHAQVDYYLQCMRAKISGGDQDTLDLLETLWESDFEPTSAEIAPTVFGRQTATVTWDQVARCLADSTDRIEVLIANGTRKTDIDYDSYRETGRSLIAIGGDKLSRGLTLEGLSVSYFLRITKQYDSLLQMGRWFGYRRGFADLCRLYTTGDMEDWFQHVATATRDLRAKFAHMQLIGATPKQYGLSVETHSIMNVTARNKQRYATERSTSYAGEGKIQTVFFREPTAIAANADAVDAFVGALGTGMISPARPGNKGRAAGTLWRDVPGSAVADLLISLRFPAENVNIEGPGLANFVRSMLDIQELTHWSVFLPSAGGTTVTVAGQKFGSIERSPRKDRPQDTRYIIRSILSPEDEAIDLTDQEYAEALNDTNQERAAEGEDPTDRPAGPNIRRIRGRRPQNGLIILYPLDPKVAEIETDRPIFGVMISFPESENARKRIFLENAVRTRELSM